MIDVDGRGTTAYVLGKVVGIGSEAPWVKVPKDEGVENGAWHKFGVWVERKGCEVLGPRVQSFAPPCCSMVGSNQCLTHL